MMQQEHHFLYSDVHTAAVLLSEIPALDLFDYSFSLVLCVISSDWLICIV